MKTMRLRLERDPDMPVVQRLRCAWVEVPLREILLSGIHPWQGPHSHPTMQRGFSDRLNGDGLKIEELAEHGYCLDIHADVGGYPYADRSPLERLLEQVGERVRFVGDGFGYQQLRQMAKERLCQRWTHGIVWQILGQMHLDFNGLRRFLKARAPQVRLQGYADVERYDLAELLSLEDFDGQPDLLIPMAMPGITFRKDAFIASVTADGGYLSLLSEIKHFQLRVHSGRETVTYNCRWAGETVRLIPDLKEGAGERALARQTADRWSGGRQRYCFSLRLDDLCATVEGREADIAFPSLNYVEPVQPPTSQARVCQVRVAQYQVTKPASIHDTAESIRLLLGDYGVSRQGNKAALAQRLAALSARVYGEHEGELEAYFRAHRFIRAGMGGGQPFQTFPVLQGCSLGNMVLTMYLLRHLRGDAIVQVDYEDDSYDLPDLALALLERRVQLAGSFLRVEESVWQQKHHR